MTKTGAFIPDNTAEDHKELYGSVNYGVVRSVTVWPHLRKIVLMGLHGFFEDEELDHLIKLRRGMAFDPAYAVMPESLMLLLKQNPRDDGDLLKMKIKAIEPVQALMIIDWIDCYLKAEKKAPDRLPGMRKELLKCQEEKQQ